MQHWYYIYVCTYGWVHSDAPRDGMDDIRYGIRSHSSSRTWLSVQKLLRSGAQRRRQSWRRRHESWSSRTLFFIGDGPSANKQSGISAKTLFHWSRIVMIPFSYMIWFQSHTLKAVSGPMKAFNENEQLQIHILDHSGQLMRQVCWIATQSWLKRSQVKKKAY